MKRMKPLLMFIALMSLITQVNAQTIVNGDFEQGNPAGGYSLLSNATGWFDGCGQWFNGNPSSCDLYGANNIPAQGRVNPRLGATYNFAGMVGPNSESDTRESVINEVSGSFTSTDVYTLSFFIARAYFSWSDQPTTIQMEALLRINGNCVDEKLIPINVDIPVQNFGFGSSATNNWTLVSTTFTLSTAEFNQGFNSIEIRPKYTGVSMGVEHIFIDDVVLTKEPVSLANLEPYNHIGTTEMNSLNGPIEVERFCAPDVFADGSGSVYETDYYLELYEFDLGLWTATQIGPTIGPISGSVPSNIDVDALFGTVFSTNGQVYMLKLSVAPNWNSDYMFFVVEECCPDELELEVDCENGLINITNIPASA
ncbi:MAG: hypothetical protein HRT57_00755, partial [Crocinitomicaceae bacterium]|nr:hypothetical protein [Crocinitomicaceae bacterium]